MSHKRKRYNMYLFFLNTMQVNTCMRVRKEKKAMVYFVVTTYYDEEKDKEDNPLVAISIAACRKKSIDKHCL